MARLLVLCRHPYHLPRADTQAWLTRELRAVLRRDELEGVTLTRLGNPSSQWTRSFDWLIEFRVTEGIHRAALSRGGACAELLADLRLMGMEPAIALADYRGAVTLRP